MSVRVRNRSHSLLAAALALAAAATPRAASAGPVLLELFTSQGCSSCPPADRLLARLATRPDLLPLDLHVDYWNNASWHDPFSTHALTARQQAYATALSQEDVYTPELVVDGTTGLVGSDAPAIETAIEAAKARAAAMPGPELSLVRDGAKLRVQVGPGTAAGGAVLYLAGYDPHHRTEIGGGENDGRTLDEANVVRGLAPIAAWSGAAETVEVTPQPGERQAAFLQARSGRILAVAEEVGAPPRTPSKAEPLKSDP